MYNIDKLLHRSSEIREESCDKHGPYESRNIIFDRWSSCPGCQESERIAAEKHRDEDNRRQTAIRRASKIGCSGIPPRFRDRSLQNFVVSNPEQGVALEFARMYIEDFNTVSKSGRSALFIGRTGTGKTHLASSIGIEAMDAGYSVSFSTVIRVIRRVKDTWSRGSAESESEAIKAFVEPDLLILDEVGVQFGSDTEKMILFDILNERYEKRRPCILMSNLKTEDACEYLGDRIIDRIREDGGKVIPFTWESYRKNENRPA